MQFPLFSRCLLLCRQGLSSALTLAYGLMVWARVWLMAYGLVSGFPVAYGLAHVWLLCGLWSSL